MTNLEALRLVIGLACCTEDRTDNEQRALLKLAWQHDCEHNQNTTTNTLRRQPGFVLSDLVSEVDESRYHGDGDRVIAMPKGWSNRWERWWKEFDDEHPDRSGSPGDEPRNGGVQAVAGPERAQPRARVPLRP